ncbi:MAG: hypothetical protein AAF705_02840, partial [Bacteroidota bacterium]
TTTARTTKWRTIIGLILLFIAIWFDWEWAWGILFFLWVIPDLISGTTYFMEPISRANHPILYWIIVISWIFLSIYSIANAFFPELRG